MDMEFEKVKEQDGMGLLDINTTAARKHIGEIEQGIFWLKECTICVVKTLSAVGICNLPRQIVIHVVYNVTTFLNAVPDALGVSTICSPREIVTRRKLDVALDYKVQFGAYIEASEDAVVSNTIKSRARECIALVPSGK